MKLADPESFIHPKQPTFVYDIKKAWEKVVQDGPIWLSKKYPPLPKEKKYSFLGQKLISPIAISAGPASKKVWTDFYFRMGYGFVLEKTRRTVERKAHEVPNVAIIQTKEQVKRSNLNKILIATKSVLDWEKYKSITNSFGNPSPALDVWAKELLRQKKGVVNGQLFGCSVTATFFGGETTSDVVADLLKAATAAAKAGVSVIEFNLACPNVTDNKEEGEMFQDANLVSLTLEQFKKKFPKIKAGFKFGLYRNKEQMRKVFKAAGKNLDYVSGINAIAMTVLGKNGKELLPGRTKSGVCGELIQDIALESIRWADQIRKEEKLNYEILGGGGIVQVSDVDRYLKAGADTVQVTTIAMVDPLFAYKYMLYKHWKLS